MQKYVIYRVEKTQTTIDNPSDENIAKNDNNQKLKVSFTWSDTAVVLKCARCGGHEFHFEITLGSVKMFGFAFARNQQNVGVKARTDLEGITFVAIHR